LDRLRADLGGTYVVGVEELAQRRRVHRVRVAVEQTGPVEFAEQGRDAPRPMAVLDVVDRRGRGQLADARDPAGQFVDLLQAEVDARLLRGGEQVQDRVGRAAHRDVEGHRVLERLAGGDAQR